MPDLIRLVHGNVSGLAKLRDLFRRQWTAKCLGKTNLADITDAELEKCPISKRQLERKIQSIATKEKRVVDKVRWYVHRNILSMHGLDHLSVAESTPEMSSDCRQGPYQTPSLLGMPTIIQFARPSSSVAKQSSPPCHNVENRTSNGLDPSLQNRTLNSTTTESNAAIKNNLLETKPKLSVVEKNIKSNNTKNKNLPTEVLSKPFVVVIDDDDGSDGGKEQSLSCKSSADNVNIQEACSENNVVTSSLVRPKITSSSEQKEGKFKGEVSEEAEPMDVDG